MQLQICGFWPVALLLLLATSSSVPPTEAGCAATKMCCRGRNNTCKVRIVKSKKTWNLQLYCLKIRWRMMMKNIIPSHHFAWPPKASKFPLKLLKSIVFFSDDRFWITISTIPKGVWRVFKKNFWKKNDFQKFSPSKWQPSHIFAEHPTPYYESSGDGYQMVYPDVSQNDHPGKYLKKIQVYDETEHERIGKLILPDIIEMEGSGGEHLYDKYGLEGHLLKQISSSWHFRTPQQRSGSIHAPDVTSTDDKAIHLRPKRAPERRARGNLSVLDSAQASFDTVGVIAF